MARNFLDGRGYSVHRDILAAEDCKTTWGRVEKIWAGGNQVPHHFDPVFNVKPVEEQRKDPALPQRYMSKPSKTSGMASALIKKIINSINDRVPDPFEGLFEMFCSIIVSGAESGEQLPHTDVSTAPDVLPPPNRYPSSCHISTFVALSPQYRNNVQAGTALGEATEERWDEVLLRQGEVSYAPFHVKTSSACTMTGEMSWAERERNRGCCVQTGGPGSTSGGLKISSTICRVASTTRTSNPTSKSNICPKVGTSSPPSPSSRPRQSLSSKGRGGVEMHQIRLNPPMTPIGGPLREQCPLHLLPGGGGGGGEPVVPGGTDKDEDGGREGGFNGRGGGGDVGIWGYTAPHTPCLRLAAAPR